MKKIYMKPATEIIVLNLGEPVAWGDLADASNSGNHNDGKEADTPWDYVDDEEQDSKFSWSVWGDEDEEEDI